MHLCVVAGFGEFTIALQQSRGQVCRPVNSLLEHRSSDPPDRRVHGIKNQEVERVEDPPQQISEALAKGASRPIRFTDQIDDVRGMRLEFAR